MDFTFNGQLLWTIEAQNFESDIAAANIEREILATRETWTPAEKNLITELSILLSCTTSVEIVGSNKPAPAVVKMAEIINKQAEVAPADLIVWRLKLPYKLRNAWESAWTAGQDMFTVDPAQLPTESLSIEQQEQAKDPKSFLAETG